MFLAQGNDKTFLNNTTYYVSYFLAYFTRWSAYENEHDKRDFINFLTSMLLEQIVRIVYVKIRDKSMKFDEQSSKESFPKEYIFNLASK